MAKYEVKMSCGHTETVNLFGPMKDRERKIAWLGEHGICTDCYKAQRETAHAAATAEAAIKATEENLPALTGSEKQINWALTIRANKLADLAKMVEEGNAKIADQAQRDKNQMACQAVRNVLVAKTDARFWIDNRDVNAKNLIAANNLQDEFKAEFAKLSDAASGKQMAIDDAHETKNPSTGKTYTTPLVCDFIFVGNDGTNYTFASGTTLAISAEATTLKINNAKVAFFDTAALACAAVEVLCNFVNYCNRYNKDVCGVFVEAEFDQFASPDTVLYEELLETVSKNTEGSFKMTTIEKYLQARDEVSFKYNKAGAKIWYRAHAIIGTGAIDNGKANAWSCDHDIKINRFQAALILEKYGLTIEQFIDAEKEFYATRYPETNNEADPDDYAVSPDALEVAVNAEIQLANNAKINELKWEIRYTEGSINDLDKNHLAQFPQDQSLKERRAELLNELAALKAQLADLLPTEVNTNSEYKYYIQSRRPIAGAVPNGYISATAGEMKVHSLRSDGSISPVPRKVVFGVVVYDHPLSDEQIINYDLHVDPLNRKDCTSLDEANAFVNQKDIDGIYVGGIYYAGWEITDRNGNIVADHNTGIKITNTTQAEYLADKHVREVKALDDSSTDRDEVFALLPNFDEQPTMRERYYKAHMWLTRTISNGKEYCFLFGRRVKKTSLEVKDHLYHYGLTVESFIAEENKLLDEEHRQDEIRWETWRKQWHAEFIERKIKHESKSIGDSSTDRDAVFGLLPALGQLNDVDDGKIDYRILIRKWNEIIYSSEFKNKTAKIIFKRQGSKHQFQPVWWVISVEFDKVKGKFKFYIGPLFLAKYDTPAQVDKVIALIQAAIARGDMHFKFPTVEELDPNPDDELIDPTDEPELILTAKQKKSIRDSLHRAKQIALENIRAARKNHDRETEDYERTLYDICNQALKEVA